MIMNTPNRCDECKKEDLRVRDAVSAIFSHEERRVLSMVCAQWLANGQKVLDQLPLNDLNRLPVQRDLDTMSVAFGRIYLSWDDLQARTLRANLMKLGIGLNLKRPDCEHFTKAEGQVVQ